jgi:hypothetical protein
MGREAASARARFRYVSEPDTAEYGLVLLLTLKEPIPGSSKSAGSPEQWNLTSQFSSGSASLSC